MVGMPWPQHMAFLDDPQLVRRIRRNAMSTVCELAEHPALLMFAVGNENLARRREMARAVTNRALSPIAL